MSMLAILYTKQSVTEGTYNVHRRIRRNVSHARENKRHADLPDEAHTREHACCTVHQERREEPYEPEILQITVHCVSREEMLGADSTPDDARVVERLDVRAGEEAGGLVGANVLDGAHSPLDGGQLAQTRPDGGNELGGEHRSLRDMHVVAELEILAEVQRLRHDDVSEGLEHHHSDGVAGLNVSDDEFSEDVEAELDVGEGLDDADGDRPCGGDDEGEDDRVPCHACGVCEGAGEGETDHDDEKGEVPPCGDELVLAHDLHVDVVKFPRGGSPAAPDLRTGEEVGVADEGGDGCKVHAVGESGSGSKEQGGVCLVLGWVNHVLGCEDTGGVVGVAGVVDDLVLRDGEVVRVPYSRVMQSWRDDPDKDHDTDTSVGVRYSCDVSMFLQVHRATLLTVPRADQRTVVERVDLSPIQSEPSERETQRDTSSLPKKLVDNHIVRLDPSNPREVTERWDDERRKERPDEHANHNDHEKLVSGNRPAVRLRRIVLAVIMQRIHEPNVDQ